MPVLRQSTLSSFRSAKGGLDAAAVLGEFLNTPRAWPSPSGPTKILVVNGRNSVENGLRPSLEVTGQSGEPIYEVVATGSTSEALAIISTLQIDVVLIDLLAPELGGSEFCRMLKRNPHTQFLPIFIVADSDDLDNEVSAINSGADEFLVRPLRPKAVSARIQASLRHRAMVESLDDSEAVFFSLAQSVEERDPAVGSHCQRLALMATAMGLTLGLPQDEILTLQRGGYLHDIGKVAIPDRILLKAGPLSPQEWEVMRSHAERGERICSNMRSLSSVLPIIRHHHERWDGSGYPDRLRGEEIPLHARIIQLADIYDALTAERPYKPAYSSEEAMRILQDEAARGWRDPFLVETFSDVLPLFRAQSPMEISTTSLQALADALAAFTVAGQAGNAQRPAMSSSLRVRGLEVVQQLRSVG
ncbi:MAG TPA: HD domain-containing phosphohydrolase [Bryobacteraceae bacterium]|jgi:putative two-component system response regulator|nr:HD domain-containing phosphohydrolase [Bryobacteraceae bacterium]